MKIFKFFCIVLNIFSFVNETKCMSLTKLNIKQLQFNVRKDSLWISYPIKHKSYTKLTNMIPKTHRLHKCKIFENDKPKYRLFYNIFEVSTPFFHGTRMEIVTIIQNKKNKETSFVVLDCFTNAMAWNPIDGLKQPNGIFKKKITNRDYCIEMIENIKEKNKNDKFKFIITSNKTNNTKLPIRDFTIVPNYFCYFKNYEKAYPLDFNENDINMNVNFLDNIFIDTNIYKEFIKKEEHIFIYPKKMQFKVILN